MRTHKLRSLNSGGSRPSDKGRGGGIGGHPDPEMRVGGGAVSKKIFSALRASFWSKNKGGPGQPSSSPGPATVKQVTRYTNKSFLPKQ